MANVIVSPVQINQNAQGVTIEYAQTNFLTALPVSLAAVFGGVNTVSPNGNGSDVFVYNLPRFTKQPLRIYLENTFTAKVITANTVTAGLNPSIHLYPNGVQTLPGQTTIRFDGRGAQNEFFPIIGVKNLGLDALSTISVGELTFIYAFNNADFSSSALFAPSLVTNQIVLYPNLTVHVQY